MQSRSVWGLIFSSMVTIAGAAVVADLMGAFAPGEAEVRGRMIDRIELTDLQGNSRSFDELKGQDSLVVFWASWCKECVEVIRSRQSHEQGASEQRVVYVSLDEEPSSLKAALIEYDIDGEVWVATDGAWPLQRKLFGNELGKLPFAVLLDDQTRVLSAGAGVLVRSGIVHNSVLNN